MYHVCAFVHDKDLQVARGYVCAYRFFLYLFVSSDSFPFVVLCMYHIDKRLHEWYLCRRRLCMRCMCLEVCYDRCDGCNGVIRGSRGAGDKCSLSPRFSQCG